MSSHRVSLRRQLARAGPGTGRRMVPVPYQYTTRRRWRPLLPNTDSGPTMLVAMIHIWDRNCPALSKLKAGYLRRT